VPVGAVEEGFLMPSIWIVRVWTGMLNVVEFMFVSYTVLEDVLIEQIGFAVRFVPVTVAHDCPVASIVTSAGNLILNLPEDVKGSLIVTEKMYEVFLLTTSEVLEVKDPVKVVAIGVSVCWPICRE
jgi:hypothetical protein